MRTIKIDEQVWEKLQELAVPLVDEANDVLRRVLGLDKKEGIAKSRKPQRRLPRESDDSRLKNLDKLRTQTSYVKPAFLTFLVWKYHESLPPGTSFSAATKTFMTKVGLKIDSKYWNPWMKDAYKDWSSCQKTIAHFRECRKFGCWNGRNSKANCREYSCAYHPENPVEMKNKCDLTKGVIWRRQRPDAGYELGVEYMNIIKTELLECKSMPLPLMLSVFYPGQAFNSSLVERFRAQLNLSDAELRYFFEY